MKSKTITNLLLLIILLLPAAAWAADSPVVFKPLVGIPGVDGNADFNTYINALYALSISLAALLAVIKIIIAGVKWMLSDVVTSKQEAKSDMQGALLGLLIVISAVVVLNVINPQLTQTSLFVAPASQVPGNGIVGSNNVVQPPANQPPAIPSDKIACTPSPRDASLFDCVPAAETCRAGKGSVLNPPKVGELRITPELTCLRGVNETMRCSLPFGQFDDTGVYDCSTQEAQCKAKNGVPSQLSAEYINCYVAS